MSPSLISSSVAALVVALFNLLLAGYGLAEARSDRSKLLFAAGPLGAGAFAFAWFISLLDPDSFEAMRTVSGWGALLSVTAFTADAVRELPQLRRRALLLGWAGLTLAAVLATLLLRDRLEGLELTVLLPRLVLLPAAAVAITARLLLWSGPAATHAFRRHAAVAAVIAIAAYGLLCLIALRFGDGGGLDPSVLAFLIAEAMAAVHVLDRRVEARLLLSRAVTYALLSMAVAFTAAATFRRLGYPVDLVQVTVTVAIALFAAVLFMGLGELFNDRVERVLFPDQARVARQLVASRGELAALRRRLERAERLAIAGELAASVAHEIKNPLAALSGYAQLLAATSSSVESAARPQFEKAVRIIREESGRIDAKVAALLDLGRKRDRPSLDETVDPVRVLLEAIAVAEGEPSLPHIVHRLDPALGLAAGGSDELRGAILNLLKNAAEASPLRRDGRIEVHGFREGSRVIIEILDEGSGLQEQAAERLFEAFFTTKAGGTGLGLAIARSAVEAAGGRLTLKARSDRRGAVARLELVARAPVAAAPLLFTAETP